MEPERPWFRFRLIDLFVVLGLVGGFLAIFVPSVQAAREAARRMRCQSYLKQIGFGIQNYHDTFGELPANYGPSQPQVDDGNSWLVSILPFVEKLGLFSQLAAIRAKGGSLDDAMAETYLFPPPPPASNSGFGPIPQLPSPALPQVIITTFLCPTAIPEHRGLLANRQGWQGTVAGLNGQTLLGVTCYKGVCGSNWGEDLVGNKTVTMPGLAIGQVLPTVASQGEAVLERWKLPSGVDVSYVGHDYGDGIFPRNAGGRAAPYLRLADVTDGTSRTFAIGEVVPAWCDWSWWYGWNASTATCALRPNHRLGVRNLSRPGFRDVLAESGGFHSQHPGGVQFGMLDCSVHYLKNDVDPEIYRALATYRGGDDAQLYR